MRGLLLAFHVALVLGCSAQFTPVKTVLSTQQDQETAATPVEPDKSDTEVEAPPPVSVTPTTPVVVPTYPSPSPSPIPSPAPSGYSFDEVLPDPYSAFGPLRSGQTTLANVHRDPRTGAAGSLGFPANWNVLGANKSLRLKVLVPAGVSMVSWYVESANMVAYLGACDGSGSVCQEQSYPPTLWPVGYNSQAGNSVTPVEALPAVAQPKIVYLTVRALSVDFWFLSLSVSYRVQDPVLYESWRAQRSWAGGSGDCDGLGGTYCR